MILFLPLLMLLSFSSLDCKDIAIPQPISEAFAVNNIPEEHAYRIPTLNKYGYMFTKFDPITNMLLASVRENPNISIFEVGGAYGNVAEAALDIGVKQYDLNDCEPRHLEAFAKKIQQERKSHYFSSLSLIAGRCPDDVKITDSAYDAILVNKVLHFFTPETIDNFIHWLRCGLKPGGKAYILTISPFYKGHESQRKSYFENKAEKKRFPGFCPSYGISEVGKKYPQETRPNSLLFMELETLKGLFIQHGFIIENEYELSIIDDENSDWSPGHDMVGIIAIKPNLK